MSEPEEIVSVIEPVLEWSEFVNGRRVYYIPLAKSEDYACHISRRYRSVDAEFFDNAYRHSKHIRRAVGNFKEDIEKAKDRQEIGALWNNLIKGVYAIAKRRSTSFDLGDSKHILFDDEYWTVILHRMPGLDKRSVGVLIGKEMHEIGSAEIERNHAIARLLASVPDLYRGARAARDFVGKMLKDQPLPDDIREGLENIVERLDRAICKANGSAEKEEEEE